MGLISEERHRQTNLVGSDMVGLCKNGWFLAETEYGIQVYHKYFSEGKLFVTSSAHCDWLSDAISETKSQNNADSCW